MTIQEFSLSCAKRLNIKQLTDKPTSLWALKWLFALIYQTSTAETTGDDAGQIQASAEIRRVSELLMAINGRRAKSPNTIV